MKLLPPIYAVTWVDATSAAGWMELDDAEEHNRPAEIITVGFLISANKKSIILAQGLADDAAFLNFNCIPTAWILKRKRLK